MTGRSRVRRRLDLASGPTFDLTGGNGVLSFAGTDVVLLAGIVQPGGAARPGILRVR